MAFDPSNMPPGIEASPDKMLQVSPARRRQLCSIVLQYCNTTAASTATVFTTIVTVTVTVICDIVYLMV